MNVIRSVEPVCSLPLLFSLPPVLLTCSPLFTSAGSEQSSLAIQMGSCVSVRGLAVRSPNGGGDEE